MAHFCAIRSERSSRNVLSASTVATGLGRKRAMTRCRTEPGMGLMVAYENAGRESLVVLPRFPSAELRAGAALLDADRSLPVRPVPAAGFAELHLPLVPPADGLADAPGGLHHPIADAAARDRPGRRFLGGDGARHLFHAHVRRRARPRRVAVAAWSSARTCCW